MAKDLISFDLKSLNNLVIGLNGFEREMPNAAYSAVKRTLSHVRTSIGRLVPQEYQIKTTDVKNAVSNPNVQRGQITKASLLVKGRTLSFAHFKFTPRMSKTKRKVKVKIKRQDGYKPVETNPLPFVASTGAASADKIQNNVFRRLGKERLPIVVLRTLSVPQMVGNEKIAEQIQQIATEKLDERITHEIEYRLDKIKKRQESK